jgi:biotin carboxylase
MSLKKALLLGTSFSVIPLFIALKKRALNLSVCGNISSDPCHSLSNQSFFINYADKNELLEVVKTNKIDYLIPSCNDYSYLSGSWVANQLGLVGFDSYETTEIIHNKNKFREFTQKHNFPVPKAMYINKGQNIDAEEITFPVLVKPIDSFSGRGVSKVSDNKTLASAIEHGFSVSKAETLVIEEFIEGSLHSHSCFIKNGEIVFDIIADEYCTVYPYQVNCSNIPSKLKTHLQKDVKECISELIRQLALVDGLLHTQIIINEDRFWLIECMRRAPGDLYGKMVELSTNIDYASAYVNPFIKEEIDIRTNDLSTMKYVLRHTLSTSEDKRFDGVAISLPNSVKNILSIPLKESGQALNAAPYDKAGIIFAEAIDNATLFDITPKLADKFIL